MGSTPAMTLDQAAAGAQSSPGPAAASGLRLYYAPLPCLSHSQCICENAVHTKDTAQLAAAHGPRPVTLTHSQSLHRWRSSCPPFTCPLQTQQNTPADAGLVHGGASTTCDLPHMLTCKAATHTGGLPPRHPPGRKCCHSAAEGSRASTTYSQWAAASLSPRRWCAVSAVRARSAATRAMVLGLGGSCACGG
jgi:hypothetical protein